MKNSNDGNQNGLIGALVGAVVNQAVASGLNPTPGVSRMTNLMLLGNEGNGLLVGPLHPDYEQRVREERDASESRQARRTRRTGVAS